MFLDILNSRRFLSPATTVPSLLDRRTTVTKNRNTEHRHDTCCPSRNLLVVHACMYMSRYPTTVVET
jgi:hypothetical protein